MDDIVIPADKKYRSRMLRFLALGLVIGGGAVALCVPTVVTAMENAESRLSVFFHIIDASLMILFLLLIPFAIYLLGLGKLTIATRRFPPPGIRVIRDTRLAVGEKAILQGRAMILSSIIMVALAVWGIIQVYRLSRFPMN